jgi:DNA modification methylase/transcription elongation factor Elf1
MNGLLPKWVFQRYIFLWNEFANNPFNYEAACSVLKEKDMAIVSVVLSELKKNGWLSVELDPTDTRKRIYKLKSPNEMIKEIGNFLSTKEKFIGIQKFVQQLSEPLEKEISEEDIKSLLEINKNIPNKKVDNFYNENFSNVKKSGIIYNMHIYWTKQNPFVVSKLIEYYTRENGFVLDAFCGSGMTGLAARMVGRNAILIDLSPSAVHIAKNYTKLIDPEKFKAGFIRIFKKVENELKWMFKTKCPKCKNPDALVESTILSDVYSCPFCSNEVIYANTERWKLMKEGNKLKEIRCDKCGKKFEIKNAKFIKHVPIEIRVRCDKCKVNSKNKIKKLDEEDYNLWKKIENMSIPYEYPKDIPFFGHEPKRNYKKGIYYPYQMFSKRNLIVLSAFWNEIKKEKGELKDKLMFLFTSVIFNVSLMVRWHYKYDIVLTGTRTRKGTLYIPPIINDVNPFLAFQTKFEIIYKGIKELHKLFKKESIVFVKKGSALNLSFLPSSSIDYVYYDPPYGSNIDYSGINLMWDVWLGDTMDIREEVVENPEQGKTIEDYRIMLTKAFSEVFRVLKSNSFFSLVFSYSQPEMWGVVQKATYDAGFTSDFNIITVESKSKTAVQSVSLKSQQRFFIITFKKSNKSNRKLKEISNFEEYVTKKIKEFLLTNSPASYDRIYDYIILSCWKDGIVIKKFNLEKLLKENFNFKNGGWSL